MKEIVGIAWYKDESTFRRAREKFVDASAMPATYEEWKSLVARQVEEVKAAGNTALRADIDPESFTDWANRNGQRPDARGRVAYVNQVELEYRKTGKGTVIE